MYKRAVYHRCAVSYFAGANNTGIISHTRNVFYLAAIYFSRYIIYHQTSRSSAGVEWPRGGFVAAANERRDRYRCACTSYRRINFFLRALETAENSLKIARAARDFRANAENKSPLDNVLIGARVFVYIIWNVTNALDFIKRRSQRVY